MAVYTVTAHTGNRLSAGTNSRIYIKLRGTQEESGDENLNCFKRLWQGSKQECRVHTNACLGDLVLVTLYGKHFMGLYNQWFCDQISIETPEGDQILFPCYQWIGCREKVVLTPAKATLAFIDCHPIAYKHRICHLQDHRETFRWHLYAEDTPQVIDCDTPFDLPAEVQFSFTKTTEFLAGAGKQLAALNLLGLADSANSWESLWHLDMVLCEGRSQVIEYVKDHWDEDEFFGYQFLNGLNPMMIRRCLELPANFPVTDDMVKHSLQGCSLELEMKRGKIFLSDYKMLDGLVGNVIHCEQ